MTHQPEELVAVVAVDIVEEAVACLSKLHLVLALSHGHFPTAQRRVLSEGAAVLGEFLYKKLLGTNHINPTGLTQCPTNGTEDSQPTR